MIQFAKNVETNKNVIMPKLIYLRMMAVTHLVAPRLSGRSPCPYAAAMSLPAMLLLL